MITVTKLGINIPSLSAQRQLEKTTSELSSVFERLSSGMRINRPSDDAAGASIADSLRADRIIARQGVRNLNDGISLLNIADSAIESLSGITLRLTELAEQAANGSYSKVQRQALNAEAQALSQEFYRIARSTTYNGKNLFTGQNPLLSLQAGAGPFATLGFGMGGDIGTGTFNSAIASSGSAITGELDSGDFNGDGNMDYVANTASGLTVFLGNGVGGTATPVAISGLGILGIVDVADMNNDGILDVISASATTMNVALGRGDGTFSAIITFTLPNVATDLQVGDVNGDGLMDVVATTTFTRLEVYLGTGGGNLSRVSQIITDGSFGQNITLGDFNGDGRLDVAAANAGLQIFNGGGDGTFTAGEVLDVPNSFLHVGNADLNGDGHLDIFASNAFTASLDVFLSNGNGTFAAASAYSNGQGYEIEAGDLNGDGFLDLVQAGLANNFIAIRLGRGDGTFGVLTSIAINGPQNIELRDFNNDGVLDILTEASNGSTFLARTVDGVSPLLPFSLATQAGARQALPILRNKLNLLTSQRGELGAHLARIDVAKNVLSATSENFAAAESRIRDADIAEETGKLVRLQILQQAAQAVLAQANQQPALVLKLLDQ